jgi:hypothetical protein
MEIWRWLTPSVARPRHMLSCRLASEGEVYPPGGFSCLFNICSLPQSVQEALGHALGKAKELANEVVFEREEYNDEGEVVLRENRARKEEE